MGINGDSTDNELIKLAISGQLKAYDTLLTRYQQRVSKLIARHIDDEYTVNDISQDVFLKVFQNLSHFKHNSSFYTWLYRITQNTIKNHYKGKSIRSGYIEVDITKVELVQSNEALCNNESPESLTINDEILSRLSGAYLELSHDLRECVLLYDISGLSYHEIAKQLNCPVGTVRSRIHRARSYVNQSLSND
jgi:RNA polymerase sigma-70 factor (ECF subfamily)